MSKGAAKITKPSIKSERNKYLAIESAFGAKMPLQNKR